MDPAAAAAGSRRRIVVISGHCQPPHRGHVEYCRQAREFAGPGGRVIFIINSDYQATLKKGFSFMPEEDRLAIMGSLKYVDEALVAVDQDRTVCATLKRLCAEAAQGLREKPTHFGNGGDVFYGAPCPEEATCSLNGIEIVYGFGPKVQSSSWIIAKVNEHVSKEVKAAKDL
jgi:cytidyltransferase-like protein